ncbi:MAG: putative SAM-dependent methyltransferase [Myxococcales bacterium]|nr:putative SAM-dependent methyltransferase [Myxococcales bacterium]
MPPSHPLATAEPWNLVAGAYATESLRHFDVYAKEALRLAALPPGARVADVACGPGTISLQAAAAGARVDAIDISEAMLDELAKRAQAAGLTAAFDARLGDGQKLPFESAAYDGAFSMFGLMFFPDRHAGLLELRRVLRPGGRAVISSWVPFEGPFGELMQAASEVIPGLPLGAGRQPMGTADEIVAEMTAAGLRDVRVELVPYTFSAKSFESFWASVLRTNAPLVLVRERLGAERWAEAAPQIRERVRAALGDGPVELGRGAYLGVGVA